MGLKAPGILTFTLSIILVVIAAGSKYAQAHVPIVNGNEFALVVLAHLVLVIGCVVRGL
jgi:hypothetical protein